MKVRVQGRVWRNVGLTEEQHIDIIVGAESLGEGLGIVGRELRELEWTHGELEARPFTSVKMSW